MNKSAQIGSLLLAIALLGVLGVVVVRSPSAAPAGAAGAVLTPAEHGLGRVRVEVLNGGDVSGMARVGRDALRDAGFDVVSIGNTAALHPDSSVVIDRVGNREMAEAVAKALRIPNVLSEPDSNLYLDVSVLLGSNWNPEARRP